MKNTPAPPPTPKPQRYYHKIPPSSPPTPTPDRRRRNRGEKLFSPLVPPPNDCPIKTPPTPCPGPAGDDPFTDDKSMVREGVGAPPPMPEPEAESSPADEPMAPSPTLVERISYLTEAWGSQATRVMDIVEAAFGGYDALDGLWTTLLFGAMLLVEKAHGERATSWYATWLPF